MATCSSNVLGDPSDRSLAWATVHWVSQRSPGHASDSACTHT